MKKIILHIALILTAMMITMFILDYLNPLMGFLSRGISKVVIVMWVASIVAAFTVLCMKMFKRKKLNEDDNWD